MMSLVIAPVELKNRFPKWLLPAFGYTISAVSLVYVLMHTPLHEIGEDLRHLNWFWVTLAVVLDLASIFFHGLRWRIILQPAEDAPLWRCIQAVLIGLFASEVLPAKAGEVVRGYLLTHWTKVDLPLSITSVVIEAVIDGIWLVLIYLLVTAGLTSLPHQLVQAAWALGIGVALLSAVFLYLLFHKQHSHQMVSGHKWASQFTHWLDELHKMGQWRTLASGMGISFLSILFQILSIWALLHADQYDFDVRQAGLIVMVFRLGTLVPNAPGNLGTLQFFTQYGVRLVGGEPGSAAVFGQIAFTFITLVRIIEGGIAILLTGINLTDVRRHAHHAHEARMRPRRVG